MEEMHRQVMGKGVELLCPLQVYYPPVISMCSPPQKLHEPHPLGFLKRLHYIRMVGEEN